MGWGAVFHWSRKGRNSCLRCTLRCQCSEGPLSPEGARQAPWNKLWKEGPHSCPGVPATGEGQLGQVASPHSLRPGFRRPATDLHSLDVNIPRQLPENTPPQPAPRGGSQRPHRRCGIRCCLPRPGLGVHSRRGRGGASRALSPSSPTRGERWCRAGAGSAACRPSVPRGL